MSFRNLLHMNYGEYSALRRAFAQGICACDVDPVNVTQSKAFKKMNEKERNRIMNLCHLSKVQEAADLFKEQYEGPRPITLQSALDFLASHGRGATHSGVLDFIFTEGKKIDLPVTFLIRFRDQHYLRRYPELERKMQAAAWQFIARLQ